MYTDGACSGNPGRGGWAVVAFDENDHRIMQLSGGYRLTTNNRMEIMAVSRGLEKLMSRLQSENPKDTDIKVTVYSDSQLVVNTMNQGWAQKTNTDLWNQLEQILETISNNGRLNITVEYVKVKGHSDNSKNNLVDQIAVAASQPVNARGVDEYYEKITVAAQNETEESPSIVSVNLKGYNTPQDRKVEVTLSNGTVVRILPCYGGFQQTDCTEAESRATVEIAWRFQKWLNGGNI